MNKSAAPPMWNWIVALASSVPLFVRVLLLIPAALSTTTLLLGFVALTSYTLPTGFNFLKYLNTLDIASVGASILLFWYGPLVLIIGAPLGFFILLKKQAKGTNELESEPVEGVLSDATNWARRVAFLLLLAVTLTAVFSTLATVIRLPPSDRLGFENAGTTYGEIFLNSSEYLVARTTDSFSFDPYWDGTDGNSDNRPSIRADIVVVRKQSIETEFHFITTSAADTKPTTDKYIETFPSSDDPVPWFLRVLKSPFR